MGGPLQGVVRRAEQCWRYLSRYTHRVAISNRRLVAADDTGIAFRWKGLSRQRPWPLEDDAASSARVHPGAILLHLLPKGFHRIRHYGLFANTNRAENIATARALFDVTPPSRRPRNSSQMARRDARSVKAALLVPALWRSHDRHPRCSRARLPAEVAPDAEQDRHVMSQTFPVRCGFARSVRWFHASGDPSSTNRMHQCADGPLLRSERATK